MKNPALCLAILALAATTACKKNAEPAADAPAAEAPAETDAAQAPAEANAEQAPADAPGQDAPQGALNTESPQDILSAIEGEGELHAVIVTSMGEIDCKLFEEQTPITVANFVGLANGSKAYEDPRTHEIKHGNYYDGLIFHRVIPDFMIQGGCPLGLGMGGPGYQFQDEIVRGLSHSKAGTLSMANAGPGTNGSQFFITDTATPFLDGRHTVFGECDNTDVVAAIARVPRNRSDRPDTDVTIQTIRVERR